MTSDIRRCAYYEMGFLGQLTLRHIDVLYRGTTSECMCVRRQAKQSGGKLMNTAIRSVLWVNYMDMRMCEIDRFGRRVQTCDSSNLIQPSY